MFPKCINDLIKDKELIEIKDFHRSGDFVYSIGNCYILKVSNNIERLNEEYKKDLWISNYISSPKPILFFIENMKAYYLREYLFGDNLCADKYIKNPLLLIDILVEGCKLLHSVKPSERCYVIDEGFETLVHGDYCLPNILAVDGKISGFIDLGDSGIGDPWRDYAWCIWSLEYNLKTTKYTPLLLEKLCITFDKNKYDKYIN